MRIEGFTSILKGDSKHRLSLSHILWLFLAVGFAAVLLASCGGKNLSQRYTKGLEYLNKEQYGSASIEFQNCLRMDPTHNPSRFGLAICLINQGRGEAAERHLRKVLETDPDHTGAKTELIPFQVMNGEISAALQSMKELTSEDSQQARPIYLLARAQLERGDLGNALVLIQKALEIAPENTDYLNTYAEVCFEISQRGTSQPDFDFSKDDKSTREILEWEKKAKDTLDRVLEIEPTNLAAHLLMVRLHTQRGDFEETTITLEAASRIAPDDPAIEAMKVNVLLITGKIDEAVDFGVESYAAGTNSPLLQHELALALIAKSSLARVNDNETDVEKLLSDAREILEGLEDDSVAMAYVLACLGNPSQAEVIYDRLIERSGKSPEAIRVYSWNALMALAEGNRDRAESLFFVLRKDHSQSMEAWRLSALMQQPVGSVQERAREIYVEENLVIQSYISTARLLHSRGKTEESNKLFEMAAKLAPHSPLPEFTRGTLLQTNGQEQQAYRHFKRSYETDPLFPPGILALADSYRRTMQHEEALAKYDEFLALVPGNTLARNRKALSLIQTGKAEAGFRLIAESVDDNPSPGYFQARLEEVEEMLGEKFEAVVEEVLQENRLNVFANLIQGVRHFNQGRILSSQGRKEEAQEHFLHSSASLQRVLEARPTMSLAMYYLGQMAEIDEKPQAALQTYKEILRLDPDHKPTLAAVMEVYFQQRQFSEILQLTERALEELPGDSDLLLWKSRALSLLGRNEEAMDILHRLQLADPLNPKYLLAAANLSGSQKLAEEIDAIMEAAIAVNPEDPEPYLAAADLYRKKGRMKQARDVLIEAREMFPDSPEISVRLAQIYSRLGNHDEAVKALRHALRHSPDQPSILLSLALELKRASHPEEMIQVLRDADDPETAIRVAMQLGERFVQGHDLDEAERMYQFAASQLNDPMAANLGLARVEAARKNKDAALALLDKEIESATESFRAQLLVQAGDIASASWEYPAEQWRQDLERARDYYSRAVELTQANRETLLTRLARISAHLEDYAAEEKYLTQAVESGESSPVLQLLLARAKERNGKSEEARAITEKVLSDLAQAEDPTGFLARMGRNLAEIVRSDQKMMEAYKQRQDDFVGRFLLGVVEINDADDLSLSLEERRAALQRAAGYFQDIIDIRPDSPLGYRMLAYVNDQLDRPERSQEILEERLQKAPDDHGSRLQYVSALEKQGKHKKALEEIDKVLQADSGSLLANLIKARLLASKPINRPEEAVGLLEGILRAQPRNLPAIMTLMGTLQDQKRTREAIQVAELYLSLKPRNFPITTRLAGFYEEIGEYRKALEYYEKALDILPDSPEAMNNLAYAYAMLGEDLDRSLELARSALDHMPNHPSIMDTLGMVYLKRGETDKAIDTFKQVLDARPEQAATRYHLALAYRDKDMLQEAGKQLRLALQEEFPYKPLAEKLLAEIETSGTAQ